MKNKAAALLLCLLLFSGCGENPVQEAPTPAADAMQTPASTAALSTATEVSTPTPEPDEAETEFAPELPSFFGGPVFHIENGEGQETNLESIYREGSEQEMKPENRSYALVDLDGDGTDEVVLSLAMGDSEYPYGFEIVHWSEEMGEYPMPFGYAVNLRGFNDLRTDGSFTASGGACDWEICKIGSFDETGFTTVSLMGRHSAHDENGELVFSFFIGEESCSEDEFFAAVEEYMAETEPVEFFSFGLQSCRSSFVAEGENEYTLSNGLKLGLSYEEVKAIVGPPQMKETMELEVANFYKLFYRGLGVLSFVSEPEGSIDDASLVCIQILERGVETARGIAVGDELGILHEKGIEPADENSLFDLCFPSIRSGDIMAYDGVVDFYNGLAGMEEGRHLFLMMSDGLVSSILIRPAVAMDAFPPVYPSSLVCNYVSELEGIGQIDKISIKTLRYDEGEQFLESENTLSLPQMTLLSDLLSELQTQWGEQQPGEVNEGKRSYEISLHLADGGIRTLYAADEGEFIYFSDGETVFAGRSEEVKDFLENHYRWSKYDLSYMAW